MLITQHLFWKVTHVVTFLCYLCFLLNKLFFFVVWPEQGKLVGPLTVQARDPLLRLSSQLWRRLQGQPLLQRYGEKGWGWWWENRRTQGPFSLHSTLFLWFYSKMTAPAHRKRKRRNTTSLSRRPLALPGPGPAPPPKPLSSPPQRRRSCRRMKWSTHNRCVSCHCCSLFWILFHLKLDGKGSVLGLGGCMCSHGVEKKNEGLLCSAVTNQKQAAESCCIDLSSFRWNPGSFLRVLNSPPHFSVNYFSRISRRYVFLWGARGTSCGFFKIFFKRLPLCRVCKLRCFLQALLTTLNLTGRISSSAALKRVSNNRTQLTPFLETGRPHQGEMVRACCCLCAHALKDLCVPCLSAQYVTCDTKLRDQCKGTPCNRCGSDQASNHRLECTVMFNFFFFIIVRYECPAGCLDTTGKVVGTVYYEMVRICCSQSSFFMPWILFLRVKHIRSFELS